jgi:hypothetical protein
MGRDKSTGEADTLGVYAAEALGALHRAAGTASVFEKNVSEAISALGAAGDQLSVRDCQRTLDLFRLVLIRLQSVSRVVGEQKVANTPTGR